MAEKGVTQEKGQVVAVVREWEPHNHDSLKVIHDTIDGWGRRQPTAGAATQAPSADHGEVVAKVERVTRNVKARTVTVTEAVIEPVGHATSGNGEPWDGERASVSLASGSKPASKSRKAKRGARATTRPATARKTRAKATSKSSEKAAAAPGYKPQCAALTADGAQCRNSARGTSRYCAPHKGYQPPTTKGLAKRIEGEAWSPDDKVTDRSSVKGADTRPVVRKAKDTKVRVRKVAKKGRGKKR